MERFNIVGFWLLYLLSVTECEVIGIEGQNITLPCKYDAKTSGQQHVCWGRGEIPSSGGCSSEVISTDGVKITMKVSSRYQLIGDLMNGDVSLTIVNITTTDSGLYGCRVQYPGWFNDEKHRVELTINKAPVPPTSRAPVNVTVTPQTRNHTEDHVTKNSTQYSKKTLYAKSEWPEQKRDQDWLAMLLSVLIILTGLLVVLVFVLRNKWKRIAMALNITQPSVGTVGYRSSESRSGLHTREMAIENIYQIDHNETQEYECP
ncbi:hypothetical protein UPYG_G00125880 [Umbra pygmaea]|uniref:Ig-like domain-containing protein n=1 Tax=Umbra pygmaea TaxID=75934 RepID=A0ABD0X620_UMBPY